MEIAALNSDTPGGFKHENVNNHPTASSSLTTHNQLQLHPQTPQIQDLKAFTFNGAVNSVVASINRSDQNQQRFSASINTKLSSAVATVTTNNPNSSVKSTSTNQRHNHQTTNTSSAKDPTKALIEALSIKTTTTATKKQNHNLQQQPTADAVASVSTITQSVVNVSGTNSGGSRNNFKIPSDILDDLASRFIINVPDMELSNLIRICFQIELAHWFYLDFFCASEDDNKLQTCGIKTFAMQLFQHIPFLHQHLSSIDQILEDWKNYKLSVPTFGAILISEDLNYCLLVQSYFAKSSWGFPKGKVNENEDPVHCATREVFEETGYDITELIAPNDYIDAVINYQYTRLYIVRGVSLETKFSPRTRNEIKCCDWFPIDSLPVNRNDAISKAKFGLNANSFFMIIPFVKRLKKWVNDKRNGVETRRRKHSGGGNGGGGGISPTSTSPLTTINNTSLPQQQQTKSSCKKQKHLLQQRNDKNALNGGAAVVAPSTSCNGNTNYSNNSSNRSKRQRHKSMGDLDGIKLNNFNNNNQSTCNKMSNNNNCGSTLTNQQQSSSSLSTTTTSNSGGNNSNQKRHSKNLTAGSVSINNNNNNANNTNGSSSSKRQLFHSQSHCSNLHQQQNGEKIVSSFDLIRKEKQQMKAALAKSQKQQQNNMNTNGRQRAKSQSDKISMQQNNNTMSANNLNNKKQQPQQSMIVTNSTMMLSTSNSIISNHHNKNNKLNVNTANNMNNFTTGPKTPTPPPLSGNDLLALAAAAAANGMVINNNNNNNTNSNNQQKNNTSGNNAEQIKIKPRPSSVSLHFPDVATSIKREHSNLHTMLPETQMPIQLQRMASGTNLRILKRSTSHQPQQQQRQSFTPSFNSWTNFTFTKNFMANVFC
ncbi:decapping mRNA 2 isoform X2 [Haematobia irritans]|uniref:decapping mRNA 2 isoform X2 n=1 Tax=Haematobia irritans TaxID=7368 RepID=UPI003F4F67E5